MNPIETKKLFHNQALQIRAGVRLNRRNGSSPMLLQNVAVRAFERPKLKNTLTLTTT